MTQASTPAFPGFLFISQEAWIPPSKLLKYLESLVGKEGSTAASWADCFLSSCDRRRKCCSGLGRRGRGMWGDPGDVFHYSISSVGGMVGGMQHRHQS